MVAGGVVAMTSCSNDEAILPIEDSGNVVHMVVVASRDGFESKDTRTDLNEVVGSLKCKWSEGDRILVTSTSGIIKGSLTLKEGDGGKAKGTFEGLLVGINDGTTDLNYYYLGTKNSENDYANIDEDAGVYEHDFSIQEGTLASFTDYDIMSVKKSVIVKDGASYVENIDLMRRVSFARFHLNLPEDAVYPIEVTLSGEELANKASISLSDEAIVSYEKGQVTATVNSKDDDLYVTYLPTDKPYEIKFNAVEKDGDKAYSGSYEVKVVIGQNKYLRKAIKNEENVTIDGAGIPVDMTEDIENVFRITYYQNVGYHPGQSAPTKPNWQLDDLYYTDAVYTRDTKYTFTIKEYDNVMFNTNPLDASLYEFQKWTSNWNGTGTAYTPGTEVTLSVDGSIKPSQMSKDGKTYNVYTLNVYSYWMFYYTLIYDLGEGVTFTYTDPQTGNVLNSNTKEPLVTRTNGKEAQPDILDKKVKHESVSKEGYELIGWKEVGTEGPVVTDEENVWVFHQNKAIVTIEPVWKELPQQNHTVTTSGYTHSTFNK